MKALIKITACLICISLLFSSCAGTKRMDDSTIVVALGIDSEKGNTEVHMQYLNLSSGSKSSSEISENITGILSGKGNSISGAVLSASKSVYSDIFFLQNKIIVFGNDYARNDISKALKYMLNSPDSRPDVLVAISESSAADIIKSKENGAVIPADSIYKLLKLGEKNASGEAVTVCDLLNLYSDETSDIFLPVLTAQKKSVSCNKTAIFSNEKYVKTLNSPQTLGFLLAKGKIKKAQLSVRSDTLGTVSLDIINAKAKRSANTENGIEFNIEISLTLKINEIHTPVGKPLSESDFSEIQKCCEKTVSAICKNAAEECFKAKSDPYMLARYVYIADEKLYSKLKNSWRDNLPDVKTNVKVKTKIHRI